jgi:hypothetical protein
MFVAAVLATTEMLKTPAVNSATSLRGILVVRENLIFVMSVPH